MDISPIKTRISYFNVGCARVLASYYSMIPQEVMGMPVSFMHMEGIEIVMMWLKLNETLLQAKQYGAKSLLLVDDVTEYSNTILIDRASDLVLTQ